MKWLHDYSPAAARVWWVVVLMGGAALLHAWVQVVSDPQHWGPAALGMGLALLAGAFPVRIRDSDLSFGLGGTAIFLTLLLVGPWPAVLAASAEVAAGAWRSSRRASSRLVTPAAAALAMGIAGLLFSRFDHLVADARAIPLVVVCALIYYWIPAVVLQAMLGLKSRPWTEIRLIKWEVVPFLVLGVAEALIAALLMLAERQAGTPVLVWSALIIGGLMSALRWHSRRADMHAEQLATQLHRLQDEAERDALTGLPNRRGVQRLLAESIAGAAEPAAGRFALMYLDFDGFKRINDTLGHAAGDALLVAVAGRIQRQLRGGDMVARLGGDEFVVLINPVDHQAHAGALAQRLTEVLAEPHQLAGQSVVSSASIGVVLAGATPPGITVREEADRLLAAADAAMFRAKAAGKGGWTFAEPTGASCPQS